MKRALKTAAMAGAGIVLALAILLFTPLADPDLSSDPRSIESYDKAVAAIEAVKAAEDGEDLIPEADSIALLTGSRTETSVVIFHGYTSVPRQFQLIAQGYRAQGMNVWVPRWPYHGQANKMTSAFSKITAYRMRDFADDNIDIASALGRNVIVIGFSGGGSMATWASVERPEVARTILISPVLHPQGVPKWADQPLARAFRLSPVDKYNWWDKEKQADNTEGYNYPRYSLKGIAAMLSLVRWTQKRIAEEDYPAKAPLLLIRNDGDEKLDSAFNEQFVKGMAGPETLTIYRIPASEQLKHNFISPEPFAASYDNITEAYRHLSKALGIPLADPLASSRP